jgi:hypothetical protein
MCCFGIYVVGIVVAVLFGVGRRMMKALGTMRLSGGSRRRRRGGCVLVFVRVGGSALLLFGLCGSIFDSCGMSPC